MKLLQLSEVPESASVQVCKHRASYPIIMCLFWFGGLVFAGFLLNQLKHDLLPVLHGGWWRWLILLFVSPFVLIVTMVYLLVLFSLFGLIRACLLPTNWVMRIEDTSLLLQFRSYGNYGFPLDVPTVVSIPYGEIAQVGVTRKREATIFSRNSTGYSTVTYIDILLNHGDTADLDLAIKQETARPAPPRGRFGSSSKVDDVPVRVVEGNTLRMAWGQIKPSARATVRRLESYVQVRPVLKIKAGGDSTTQSIDGEILDAADRGDTITAVKLVRRRYKMGLTEAVQFIKDLTTVPPEKRTLPPP